MNVIHGAAETRALAAALPFVALSTAICLAFAAFWIRALAKGRPPFTDADRKGSSKWLPWWLRDFWLWMLGPVERSLSRRGVDPNRITLASLLVAGVAALAFAAGRIGLGGWLYLLSGTLDMIDGRVARAAGRSTRAGAFFDSVLDRWSEILVFGGLIAYLNGRSVMWLALLALCSSLMVSYARARGEGLGVSCREGAFQRPERVVYLGGFAALSPLVEAALGGYGDLPLLAGVAAIAVTATWTALTRTRSIFRALRRPSSAPARGGTRVQGS